MSLTVSYFESVKPKNATDYPVDFHALVTQSDSYIKEHLSKVIVNSCVAPALRKKMDGKLLITDIGSGKIEKNTVLWVGVLFEGTDIKKWVLINTPQLKTFEPYFVDSLIIKTGVMRVHQDTWSCEYNL